MNRKHGYGNQDLTPAHVSDSHTIQDDFQSYNSYVPSIPIRIYLNPKKGAEG